MRRMKGLFIPEITAEMFRNGCLESIESLMAEGEIYDIEYSPWIPVKTRELTAEEKEEYPDITFMWDCPLPDDDQDVLITTKWGDVQLCTFCCDDMGSYFDDCDWDDVLAWMPKPEPYKKGGTDNDE